MSAQQLTAARKNGKSTGTCNPLNIAGTSVIWMQLNAAKSVSGDAVVGGKIPEPAEYDQRKQADFPADRELPMLSP